MRTVSERELRTIEGDLRACSTDLWVLAVGDPESATAEDEAALTGELARINELSARARRLADDIDALIYRRGVRK